MVAGGSACSPLHFFYPPLPQALQVVVIHILELVQLRVDLVLHLGGRPQHLLLYHLLHHGMLHGCKLLLLHLLKKREMISCRFD